MSKRLFASIFIVTSLIGFFIIFNTHNKLPVIAIANYGSHASLNAAIKGFKEQMASNGFIENKTVHYKIADVGFDPALIPQMLSSLKASRPKLMMVMTTPVAQSAKGKIDDIPLIYNVITDPVEAGLIKEPCEPDANMTGSSDMQNLQAFLQFAKSILPKCEKVGLLYATSESNDIALVNMMRANASKLNMEVLAIAVDQARDVPIRMQEFKGKVDLIYVGTSGPIQPTLPAIALEAHKMHIPVFNVEAQAVKDGLALASFGVDYIAVGKNAGKLAVSVLNGKKINDLTPIYPNIADHRGVINRKLAAEFSIKIPASLEIVE